MTWERPNEIPFPKVWCRFQGKIPIDGKPLNYLIQDITDDLVEPILDHLCRYFLVREVTIASIGLVEDELAVRDIRRMWKEMLKEKISLVCLVDGVEEKSKRIAGCNIITIRRKDGSERKFQSKKTEHAVKVAESFHDEFNIFEKYAVTSYADAFGLSVAPQYQGDGVAYQLLKARIPLCQSIGVTVFGTLFSSAVAKNEAVKVGFEVISKSSWDKVKFNGKIAYPRLSSEVFLTAMVIPHPE